MGTGCSMLCNTGFENVKVTLHSKSGIIVSSIEIDLPLTDTVKIMLKKLKKQRKFHFSTKSICVLNKANIVLHHGLKMLDIVSETVPVLHLWLETQEQAARRMSQAETLRKSVSGYEGQMHTHPTPSSLLSPATATTTTTADNSFPHPTTISKFIYISVNSQSGVLQQRQLIQMPVDTDISSLLNHLEKRQKLTIPVVDILVKLKQGSSDEIGGSRKIVELKMDTEVIDLWLERAHNKLEEGVRGSGIFGEISVKVNSRTGVLNRELQMDIPANRTVEDVVRYLNQDGYIKVPVEQIFCQDGQRNHLNMELPFTDYKLKTPEIDLWMEVKASAY